MSDHQTTMTRRQFVGKGLTILSLAPTVPLFLDRTAWAVGDPADVKLTSSIPGMPDDRVLVVIQLAGGNDGLNTIIPAKHDAYRKARPRLGIKPADAIQLDGDLFVPKAAEGFKSLFDDGLLAAVQGVGYPNHNRSHFVSTDIWATGSPDRRKSEGWLGRYFDACCEGADPGKGEPAIKPQSAVAMTEESPLALIGDEFQPVAFTDPNRLSWRGGRQPVMSKAFEKLNTPPPGEGDPSDVGELAYLQRTAMDARISAAEIQKAARGKPKAPYPNGRLAVQLRTVARMIESNLPTRVYYVSQGGYDTHSGQANRHQRLIEELAGSVKAFIADLKAQGNLGRVLTMTFSEFGRRVAENASAGTDHGEAAPMFLFGDAVRAGLHGTHPDLEKLHRGDLAYTTDFRRVYADVLGTWLKADAQKILGAKFKPLEVVKGSG